MARLLYSTLSVLTIVVLALVCSATAKPYDRYDPNTGCKIYPPVAKPTTTTTTTSTAGPINDNSADTDDSETAADLCPICLENYAKADCITTDCGHKFHEKCLEESVKSQFYNCPMCREQIIEPPSTTPQPSTTTYRPRGNYVIC